MVEHHAADRVAVFGLEADQGAMLVFLHLFDEFLDVVLGMRLATLPQAGAEPRLFVHPRFHVNREIVLERDEINQCALDHDEFISRLDSAEIGG